MQSLKLNSIPKMPPGFEKHQGMKLYDFALSHPMLLILAMKKGGWELDPEAKARLFPSQATIKRPSKNFS